MKLYHSSPATNRRSIQEKGLVPDQVRGKIYFWHDLYNAEEFRDGNDVWEADVEGEINDYYLGVACFIEYPIPCPTLLSPTN